MNDLVRFGLLYKNDTMVGGEYGLPMERIEQFFTDQWPVAEFYFKNPITGENEMSEKRIYFCQVPKTNEIIEKYGRKLTQYKSNYGGIST